MKRLKIFSTLIVVAILSLSSYAQEFKQITLDDLFQKGTFRSQSVYGLRSMNDGVHYTTQGSNSIVRFRYATGDAVDTLFKLASDNEFGIKEFDSYEFSSDEKKMLLTTNMESIYRRSFTADYYVYDFETKKLSLLSDNGAQQSATFSPQADKIAFVRENNMYMKDLNTNMEIQITEDGIFNHIINGACDWVYEEEFGFAKAFKWSPDGKRIAFYKFDESGVKQFNMNMFKRQLYPDNYAFKYPKAGEDNSVVTIHIYNLENKETKKVDIGPETDQYIARIKWTANPDVLSLIRMNRLQNKMDILFADAASGKSQVIYSESNKYYITEVSDDFLNFTGDGKNFIITSEKDGWNHIYLFDINGNEVRQLTKGAYDVMSFDGYDDKAKRVYYTAAKSSPLNREVLSIDLKAKKEMLLTPKKGSNRAVFSNGFKYYINYHSDLNTPTKITLHNAKGKEIRVLEDNAKLIEKLKAYQPLKKEFFTFKTSEGVELNGWILKPYNFDPNKEYPVFMTQYSGPNSQSVRNSFSWGWNEYLAQEGYIIACVDPRGTGARGEEFRKMTYGQLGKYETIDQIEAAKYFGSLDYVDTNRIGIWGWSYGGYMSTSCLFNGNDVFKMAIAVAPVTNWRYYDSIYTERYMGLPQDNGDGYDQNSPINHVDKFNKGKFLLVHGSGDDNVHIQNSWELVEKLVQANKQFDMQFYLDRNHGIRGGNTTMHLYNRLTNYVFDNL